VTECEKSEYSFIQVLKSAPLQSQLGRGVNEDPA